MNRKTRQTNNQAGQLRALSWKFDVFQLAKRVRRATRHGETFLKIITWNSGLAALITHRANRLNLAHFGLQQAERTLRIAKYYCAAFNIPQTDDSFSL